VTTCFAVSAGAAATLVGLLFVAVQIGPPLVSSGPIGRRHAMARSTFTIFGVIFGLSLYFLAPGASLKARATAAIIASAAGSIRAVRTWLPVWQDKLEGRIEFRLWQTAWLLLGPVLAYAYLIARATAQLNSADPNILIDTSAGVFIVLFAIGLRNSWNLLVEATVVKSGS